MKKQDTDLMMEKYNVVDLSLKVGGGEYARRFWLDEWSFFGFVDIFITILLQN